MSRYAQISADLWSGDFLEVDPAGRDLYCFLLTRDMSMCGVVPLTPKRWAAELRCSVADIEQRIDWLVDARKVIVDTSTEELLVRAFVKRSGVLKSPKWAIGMKRDFTAIVSDHLRRSVLREIPADYFKDSDDSAMATARRGIRDCRHSRAEAVSDTPRDTPSDTPPDTAFSSASTRDKRQETDTDTETLTSSGSELHPAPASTPSGKRSGVSKERTTEVFDHWCLVMGKGTTVVLDAKRAARIEWALKNYPTDDIFDAIEGCASTPWNMGDNPGRKRYDDLTLILRDATHLERYRDAKRGSELAPRTPRNAAERQTAQLDELDRWLDENNLADARLVQAPKPLEILP